MYLICWLDFHTEAKRVSVLGEGFNLFCLFFLMMEALYGVNIPGYCLHHHSMLQNGGLFQACGTLAMDTIAELSLAVGAGPLRKSFWLTCIISHELVKQVKVCIGAILFGVEHELEHIFSSPHLLVEEVIALLKQLLRNAGEDTPVLGNGCSG